LLTLVAAALLPAPPCLAQPSATILAASQISVNLASCDPEVVRAAASDAMRDPYHIGEPVMLFSAATTLREAGHVEDAAFVFLAARLRVSRQAIVEGGQRAQVMGIVLPAHEDRMLPMIEADPALARRAARRAIEWDRSTPDASRDGPQAKPPDIAARLAELDAALANLADDLAHIPARVAQAAAANRELEMQVKAEYAKRCGPGRLDSAGVEAATRRIHKEAEALVRAHPLVLARAGGAVKSASVGASRRNGGAQLPHRLTVMVTPGSGQSTFFAEVDAESVVKDRQLASVKTTLACITDLWIGQRRAGWKDVCVDDPKASQP
jgi:hypothetical protein